jgi:hypothetical protein
MTSTPFGSTLGDDAVAYGRRFAANARFIALREVSGGIEDIELALALSSSPERMRTQPDWN